jgi:DNA polymerase III sliding clamp (beta) subunit (PCNA family)
MNILLGKHHDITSFASKDAARYVINSVHYNREVKCLEATDGSIAIRVPVVEDTEAAFPSVSVNGEAKDVIIPIAPFKKALSNIPSGGALPIVKHMRLSVSTKGITPPIDQVNLCSTDLETEQVLPTEEPKFSISIGSDILKRLAEYAERNGKELSRGDRAITFHFTDSTSPVRFEFQLNTPLDTPTKATGVLAPIRLS